MSLDIKKFEIHLENWIESAEGKEYFENIEKKNEIQEGRYRRFEKYLETHDFDKLMYKLILEHGEEWREKCWHNGCEVFPNNKLQFVINYVFDNLIPITVPRIENKFDTDIRFFKGYYFRIMHGQGSVFDLYNGDDFQHLLSA